jgi:hypothetical protein
MSDAGSGLQDFWLTSATTATSPTQLVATATREQTPSAFTEDSQFVFYIVNWSFMPIGGSLRVRDTASGTERSIAASVASVAPAGKSRLVFVTSQGDGTSNLAVVDLATGLAPQQIATKVLTTYFVSRDRKTLYYVAPDGLHVLALE